MTTTRSHDARHTLWAVAALLVLAVLAATAWWGAADRRAADSIGLSAEAEPYRDELIDAAGQCPGVVTAPRLDRLIDTSTGWNRNTTHPALGPVSVAGLNGELWESAGGGDISDVPTGIRNAATLWCRYADTLAGEPLPMRLDLPAPATDGDNPRAAALGLAAIYAGVDMVRERGLDPHQIPDLDKLVAAVI